MLSKKYGRALEAHEVKRFEELANLFKKVLGIKYDGRVISKGNESLEDIACSAKRYNDICTYYVNEIKTKNKVHMVEMSDIPPMVLEGIFESISQLEKETDDMVAAEKIYQEAFELMKSRNIKYGDSWKVLSIQSLANLCEMKLHRIANLDKLEPKIYDEMIDTLNYMVFGLLKLKSKNI